MGLRVQFIWLVLEFCAISASLVLQGSSGYEITPSPATFSAVPPIIEAAPGQATHEKQLGSISPSPLSQPNGSDFLPPLVSPASKPAPAPAPQTTKGIGPSLSPSASQKLSPTHVEAPVPVVLPPKGLPQILVPIPPIPGSLPPSTDNEPDNKAPVSLPSVPVQIAPAPREVLQSPPLMPQVPPSIFPVPVASPPSKSTMPKIPPFILPEPSPSPVSAPPPRINSNTDGVPVSAPVNETPNHIAPPNPAPPKEPSNQIAPMHAPPMRAPSVHNAPRHSNSTPPPAPNFMPPPARGSHSPASFPSPSFNRHRHARKNITAPSPLSYVVPPPSTEQGSFRSSPPSHPPTSAPKSSRIHHAPPVRNPVPFLSPKISPSGSSPRNPKKPYIPPVHALPPPPPNEDCLSITCADPLTNTPPGSPCSCVSPMQIGLRLSVALYTFFPLVSELALEIASGVFMRQSQVRIMGANAASQDPEKTIVLIDLVPLGEKFDTTTAYLTAERFWQKQVAIKASFFGDYEVLYVRYPGLPPSPPLAPSTISIIDGEPFSGHDNNGRTIKPLGVDVSKQRHRRNLNGSIIAVIVISASLAVILCCAVAWVLLLRHRNRICQPESTPAATHPSLTKSSGVAASMVGSGPMSLSFGSSIATYNGSAKTFSSSDIERATDNFNDSRILGEGGFGRVYSGVLEDGSKVAVKVLKRDDQQGGREFLAEVEMLSRLHHRNLVKLIGICTEERMRCLVYELIPNGSVESHLHGVDKDISPLDWGSRLKIALGSARALAYLHEDSSPRVIHRDFKSSNILLEQDFTPKVSDFGLARTALDEENRHISTRVMGTFGYVAPEYAMTGHLLVKSDVYSYGVVLLELLTGKKPVDMSQPPGQENLVTCTRPLLTIKEGLESIIDPSLGPNFPFDSIAKVAAIASMCVQPEVSHRPFMGEVVQALKLVCNECEATKDLGSRSCSQEDLSIDFDATRVSTNSGYMISTLQNHSQLSNYESAFDVERGLSMSELHHASARFERVDSDSFRRHSSSGPLRTGRRLQLWERMKRLSGGSVSEHGVLLRLWPGSH